ncbi:MAG TPA: DsbC family protein [Casimicrobiaceae bacterium]|nr:DsbC family protein [Casimicrobiaceae bacterium]
MSSTVSVHLRRAAAVLALAVAVPLACAQTASTQAASSQATSASATPETIALKKALEAKFPGVSITHMAKTNYLGLYEVMFDDKLIYTDAKANYIIVGSIYDANTKTNLTEARSRKLNRVAIDKLPMDLAFKRVKGNGERKLIVFSDADCPFCHRLEQEMKGLDNVTIYTFLFPIDQLHPEAASKSKKIWCAPDRVTAWNQFFESGTVPDNAGDCGDPVAQTQALGASLRISATPTLVFADGTIVPGALPLAQIEQEMTSAEAEAKKIAATKP